MQNAREMLSGAETPPSMRSRPVDHRGFPVPWFVTEKTEDGRWDFVNVRRERMLEAVRLEKCWVSGQKLGKFKAFCIGPMCAINRTAGDPPVTREIALWSVKVCPFMSMPMARRADKDAPEILEGPGVDGLALGRNPGVTGVWISKNSEYQRGRGFYLGDPIELTWWAKGRPATRDEVLTSVRSGLHYLRDLAKAEGHAAESALDRYVEAAEPIWPSA